MSVVQKCMTGEPPGPFYAFYDKNQDSKNNGWVWYHRELLLDDVNKFYHDNFKGRFGNSVPDGKGFVRFNGRRVLYRFYPAEKDNKGRDHWVLLMAWVSTITQPSEVWAILDNEIFQHVAGGKYALPEQLSVFDYNADIVKLTYAGAKATSVPADKGRWYVENIQKRGAVEITFYCEKSDGTAIIETQRKSS